MDNVEYIDMKKKWEAYDKGVKENDILRESHGDCTREKLEKIKKKRQSLSFAHSMSVSAENDVLANEDEIAALKSGLGLECAEDAVKRDLKQFTWGKYEKGDYIKAEQRLTLYEVICINKGKEDIDVLKDAIKYYKDYTDDQISNNPRRKKNPCFELSRLLVRAKEFQLANDYFSYVFKRKKAQKLNVDIVKDNNLFLSYIIEYLSNPEEFKNYKEVLLQAFKYWEDEVLIKGNKELRLAYNHRDSQTELCYIWHKYFSEYNWNEVTYWDILKSVRYGFGYHKERMEKLIRNS